MVAVTSGGDTLTTRDPIVCLACGEVYVNSGYEILRLSFETIVRDRYSGAKRKQTVMLPGFRRIAPRAAHRTCEEPHGYFSVVVLLIAFQSSYDEPRFLPVSSRSVKSRASFCTNLGVPLSSLCIFSSSVFSFSDTGRTRTT